MSKIEFNISLELLLDKMDKNQLEELIREATLLKAKLEKPVELKVV